SCVSRDPTNTSAATSPASQCAHAGVSGAEAGNTTTAATTVIDATTAAADQWISTTQPLTRPSERARRVTSLTPGAPPPRELKSPSPHPAPGPVIRIVTDDPTPNRDHSGATGGCAAPVASVSFARDPAYAHAAFWVVCRFVTR